MSWLVELALLVVLILANGVFAGAEIAIVSMRTSRVRELVASGARAAGALRELRSSPERFLATVQIGITVIGTTAAAFGGATLGERLAPHVMRLGLSETAAAELSVGAVVIVVSYLSLVLGELVPKSLGLKWSERYALRVARPLLFLSRVTSPLVWFLTWSSNLVLRVFGDQTTFSESRVSRVELLDLVEEAAEAGTVHPRSGDIAARAIELDALRVSAVMVPRNAVRTVSANATPDELTRLLDEATEEQFPVVRESDDEVVGYVTARDLTRVVTGRVKAGLSEVTRPVDLVPDGAMALAVLEMLQTRRVPFAVVVDETGRTIGFVEMADLIEEVIGTVVASPTREEADVTREPDGAAVVPGTIRVHVANRLLGLELPQSPRWSTLNGLLTEQLGGIGKPGARQTFADGTVIEVLEATPRHVQRARVWPPPPKQ